MQALEQQVGELRVDADDPGAYDGAPGDASDSRPSSGNISNSRAELCLYRKVQRGQLQKNKSTVCKSASLNPTEVRKVSPFVCVTLREALG